jgi:putative oxidoreductase
MEVASMGKSDIGLLVLRLGVGTVLAGHGAPKLFGGPGRVPPPWLARLMGSNYNESWAQGGPDNFAAALAKMDVPNPAVAARLSGAAELGGGVALALGVATPVTAGLVAFNMGVASYKAHWKVGLYGKGGYELALSLGLGALALGLTGPGAISIDRLVRRG